MKYQIVICVVAWAWFFVVLLNQTSAQDSFGDYDDSDYYEDYDYNDNYEDYTESTESGTDNDYIIQQITEDYSNVNTEDYDTNSFSTEETLVTLISLVTDPPLPPSGNGTIFNIVRKNSTIGNVSHNRTTVHWDWSKVPGSVSRFPSYIRNIQNSMLMTYFGGRSQFRKSYPSFMNTYSQKGGIRGQLNWNSISRDFPTQNIGGRGKSSQNQNNKPSNNGNKGSKSSSGNAKNNNNKENQSPSRTTNNRGNSNINQGKQNSNLNNNGRGNSGSTSKASNNRFSGSQSVRYNVQSNRESSNSQKRNEEGNIKKGSNGSKGSSGKNSNNSPIGGGTSNNNKH